MFLDCGILGSGCDCGRPMVCMSMGRYHMSSQIRGEDKFIEEPIRKTLEVGADDHELFAVALRRFFVLVLMSSGRVVNSIVQRRSVDMTHNISPTDQHHVHTLTVVLSPSATIRSSISSGHKSRLHILLFGPKQRIISHC